MRYWPLHRCETEGHTFLIAELAQAHDGSVGILHSLLEAAAATGVDAIKFQVHIADAESSSHEPFRTPFSYVDATRYDYWRRMELTESQWTELRDHCIELGVEFMATPFSNAAVDLLERLGVTRYKIGSGDACNPLLLEKVAQTGKEVLLSSGMNALDEIAGSVNFLRSRSTPLAVFQSTTKYPTAPEDVGLQAIPVMRSRFDCPIGLSDHSGTVYPGLAACALGAAAIEVHVTFDRRMFGPDSKASLELDELQRLVDGIRFINAAMKGESAKPLPGDADRLRTVFGRSLAVNKDLPAGHALEFDDLEGKKPAGCGIPVTEALQVIGRRLAVCKQRWEFLSEDDLV